MGRALFKLLIVFVSWLISSITVCWQPVHDVENHTLLSKLITQSMEQFKELRETNEVLKRVDLNLGDNGVFDLAVYSPFTNWLNYMLSPSYEDTHSLKKALESGGAINWESYTSINDEIKNSLFFKKNEGIDFQDYNRIQSNRKNVFESAVRSGLTLSGVKETTNRSFQKIINVLAKKILEARSAHEDLKIMNQILIVTTTELMQIEEVQTKQLELLATIAMLLSEESVFKVEPLKQKI